MQGCSHRDGLIQSHVENDSQQDLELESGLQHALDVLIYEKYENVEMPSHFNEQ